MLDVTEDCQAIMIAVRDLCTGNNRFTLLHMTEIFKGASTKKLIDNRHDKCKLYGRGKSWQRADIQRLFHKLVVEEYLMEELIFYRDIPNAYLRLGPKVSVLMNNETKIMFPIKSHGTLSKDTFTVTTTAKDNPCNVQLKDIRDRCYTDLLDVCRSIANDKEITMASVMNMQALKAMADRLPECEEDMLCIPHVTRANFDKYGGQLLEITTRYAAEKLCLLMDAQDAQEDAANVNGIEDDNVADDGTDWDSLAGSSTGSYSTGKRKAGNWSGGGYKKKFRRGAKRSRGKTRSPRGRGGKTFTSASAGRSARGPTLMPMPGIRK